MIIEEKAGDLFVTPKDYILMHCISADYALGAGIAKEFARRGVKAELLSKHKKTSPWLKGYAVKTTATGWAYEVNLVTKSRCYYKPIYQNLEAALVDFRDNILEPDSECKIAMPRIGCGLDRLEWTKVKEIIKNVFEGKNVKILVLVK